MTRTVKIEPQGTRVLSDVGHKNITLRELRIIMKSAELTPTAQKIDKLIRRINEGDLRIPAFQRGFVWKQDQILDLLDSIVAEYPIGSVLLWKTSEKLNSTRNLAGYKIPERDESYPVHYALDGQQRLASIYGVFSEEIAQEKDIASYNPNPNIFEISYDFEDDRFVEDASVTNPQGSIKLRELLNVTKLISALKSLDSKYHDQAQALASQFLNYEVPVVTIENRNREDVGIIFERINNTGTKLSALDLMTAWTWTDDFHLLESSNDLLDELEDKGFGSIKHKTLLQIISGIIQNTTINKNILTLPGEEVRDKWERIIECLKKAIDFLATDLKCRHLDFLPFTQQLVPIAKFFDVVTRPSAEQLQALRRYFWTTSFSNRYSTGQTSAKMDSDIEKIIDLSNGNINAFDAYMYSIDTSDLKNTKFSKANPTTRAFLLLMAQSSPLDLTKNQAVDLGVSLAQYNRKEYHHVFPQAFLKTKSVAHDKIFCVMNFCFLPSDSNKAISKKAPSDYFFNLIPGAHFKEILESNLIPLDTSLYKNDNFDVFLDKRASEVISKLDSLITT